MDCVEWLEKCLFGLIIAFILFVIFSGLALLIREIKPQYSRYDVNRDGLVNSQDYVRLYKYLYEEINYGENKCTQMK